MVSMRRIQLDQTIALGLAGFAGGRLVAVDTISRPIMNRVLALVVRLGPPDDLFDGPHAEELKASLERCLIEDAERGELDYRALINMGWYQSRSGALGNYIADGLTCPVCTSFHATYLARIASGDWKAWRPSWWVRQFACWAVAQTFVKLPQHAGGMATEGDYVRRAVERVGVAT